MPAYKAIAQIAYAFIHSAHIVCKSLFSSFVRLNVLVLAAVPLFCLHFILLTFLSRRSISVHLLSVPTLEIVDCYVLYKRIYNYICTLCFSLVSFHFVYYLFFYLIFPFFFTAPLHAATHFIIYYYY